MQRSLILLALSGATLAFHQPAPGLPLRSRQEVLQARQHKALLRAGSDDSRLSYSPMRLLAGLTRAE